MTEVMTIENRNVSEKVGKKGVARIISATNNSFTGIKYALRHESAFRQEALLLCLLAPAAFWLGESGVEVAILLMSCVLVLIVELLNTGIEAIVDRVGMEYHKLSGQAKDAASAAVFIGLLQVPIVWTLIVCF